MTIERTDRDTIGLLPENISRLAHIEERGWFAQGQDIARFCLAYAIRANVPEPEDYSSGTQTRWAAGNFDSTGEIRSLLAALYPDCRTPIRLMEYLVNEGVQMVSARINSSRQVGPAELMD